LDTLISLNSKKERIEKFQEFLIKVKSQMKCEKSIRNVFTLNGKPILDLVDLQEKEKAIFVCKKIINKFYFIKINFFNFNFIFFIAQNNNFKGLHLFCKNSEIEINEEDRKLLKFTSNSNLNKKVNNSDINIIEKKIISKKETHNLILNNPQFDNTNYITKTKNKKLFPNLKSLFLS